jgi:hypothetical protein
MSATTYSPREAAAVCGAPLAAVQKGRARSAGLVEYAPQMAAHESAHTTKLYDRRNDQVRLDQVERIGLEAPQLTKRQCSSGRAT